MSGKENKWSCICVLGVMYVCVRSQSCICVLGISSERSCICVLGVMYMCVRSIDCASVSTMFLLYFGSVLAWTKIT